MSTDDIYGPLSPLNPDNLNPLFHTVISISVIPRLLAGDNVESILSWVNIAHRCTAPQIAEVLDREPNPRRSKSKSFTKWMLGSVAKYIECWSSPSGQKLIMVTNGTIRNGKRQVFTIIPVRKIKGVWFEYHEAISV